MMKVVAVLHSVVSIISYVYNEATVINPNAVASHFNFKYFVFHKLYN